MASETPLKRQREEETKDIQEELKRQKSYNDILNILEDEEEEAEIQDISHLITSLQQELSSSCSSSHACTHNALEDCSSESNTAESKEEDGVKVMRHLLEASDDELGLPNADEQHFRFLDDNNMFNGDNNLDGCSFGDGLWEFEDEAANYYSMLQSELFM